MLLGFLVASFTGGSGSKLELAVTDQQSINFVIDTPVGWALQTSDLETFNQIIATPPAPANSSDLTSATITRSSITTYEGPDEFITEIEGRMQKLESDESQSLFNIEVANLNSENYGTDKNPAFKIEYDLRDTRTDLEYKAVNYHVYESEESSLNFLFQYSDEYSDLGASTDEIVDSYRPRP